MPGLSPAPNDHPEVTALNVDAHRAEWDAPLRCVRLLDDPALRRDHGLGVPRVAHLVVGGLDRADHLSTLFAPGHRQPLLLKLHPGVIVAVLVDRLLGLEHQHTELAPAHRRKCVPVQADVTAVGCGGRSDEGAAGVSLDARGVRVRQERSAGRTLVGRAGVDSLQIP